MRNEQGQNNQNPQCDCKAWAQISDSETIFSRTEVEELADQAMALLVESQLFDLMEIEERSNLINYIIASKKAMYRCYF